MTLRLFQVTALLSLCVLGLVSCAAPRQTIPTAAPGIEQPAPGYVIRIDDGSFHGEVANYNGAAVVLFYNDTFPQSREMEKRIHLLAEKYYGKVKFCKFFWQVDADTRPYGLEMLPTVVLYESGSEVDRIKGIPPDQSSLAKFNDDVELWLLKNALHLEGDEYSADYKYLFRNGYTLEISNY